MGYYNSQIIKLVEELSKLSGAGAKSIRCLAFHVINTPKEQVKRLVGVMTSARNSVRHCKECSTSADKKLYPIRSSDKRNYETIMVMGDIRGLAAYEKTGRYDEVYHVLHDVVPSVLGIGPGDIKLKELIQRPQSDVEEVIIATSSSLEGKTTVMYIGKLIRPTGIRATGITSGVPVDGDSKYIDEVTLLRTLKNRTEL